MKKTAVALIVLGAGFCAWWLMRPGPAVTPAPEPDVPVQRVPQARVEPPPAQKPAAAVPAAAPVDEPGTVDLAREKTDAAYRDGPMRRHRAIKAYLASPKKGEEAMENVLNFLLENGFSIDDLYNTYAVVMLVNYDYPTKEKVDMLMGRSNRKATDKDYEWALREYGVTAPLQLQTVTGVDDPVLVNGLLALVPQDGRPLEGMDRSLPECELQDGERLLTDADWMTERHRESAQKGAGQPRRDTWSRHVEHVEDSTALRLGESR